MDYIHTNLLTLFRLTIIPSLFLNNKKIHFIWIIRTLEQRKNSTNAGCFIMSKSFSPVRKNKAVDTPQAAELFCVLCNGISELILVSPIDSRASHADYTLAKITVQIWFKNSALLSNFVIN